MTGVWADAARLAATTFTVLPVRGPQRIDRAVAGAAMVLAPAVGAALGAAVAGLLLTAHLVDLPALAAACVAVGANALATRGLHLDGLADTVDALGSYRPREQALKIMQSGDVGPFGAAALALTLLTQVAVLAAVMDRHAPALLSTVVVAWATGRAAVTWACRRGTPPARPNGLGALVAGTVGRAAAITATVPVLVVGVWAVPGRPWQGPLAVLAGLGLAAVIRRHAVRRLGGVTGDVLGAVTEAAATAALLVCAAAPA